MAKTRPKSISKRPPVERNAKPVSPDKSPPTEEVIAEALQELNPQEIEFCEVYLTCYNGTKAYQQVYGVENSASAATCAWRLLNNVDIRAYLAKRMKAMFERTEEASDKLIQQLQYAAYGDINELIEYRREACRYCHGADHLYQFTPAEFRRAEADGEKFDPQGGIGFDPRKDPHPACPECHGDGEGRVFFKDTRKLGPAGLALYAGAKVGKDGIEIKTASQERARELLARILKLFEDKTEVTVNLDTATLEERFATRMRAAHERQRQVMAERLSNG
ncbi:Terminase small subunit [Azotobacter beijerinckii]|uniref:Terminase small subunit n=1 Tax=Azotobacter beijerinckii TaxID=170623 RepID=A0A1H6X5L4_9GAMM|nr:terminase small subunit [Azotobacter beijerinckii]SEJ22774.1 Terminase small subunit [Azotobacter beijerinckii]